jgi:hypothetical protein
MMPAGMKNLWLLAGSIIFYIFGSLQNPEHVVLFVLSLVFNYLAGVLLDRYPGRIFFLFGIGVNLLYLGCFK